MKKSPEEIRDFLYYMNFPSRSSNGVKMQV
jgi:hypothetical protein